jgi:hypothetical protein
VLWARRAERKEGLWPCLLKAAAFSPVSLFRRTSACSNGVKALRGVTTAVVRERALRDDRRGRSEGGRGGGGGGVRVLAEARVEAGMGGCGRGSSRLECRAYQASEALVAEMRRSSC